MFILSKSIYIKIEYSMILIPKKWPLWDLPDRTGQFTSITKKEEMEALSKDSNEKIQQAIKEYKDKKIQWEENPQKPETRIWNTKRQFDKMEPGRVEINEKEKSFKITIKKGDILQINDKQTYDDNLKEKKIERLTEADTASERAEIQDKERYELWKAYTFSFDFMIPEDFPILNNRLVIGQWKQKSAKDRVSNNPLLCQRFKNGIYSLWFNNTGDPEGKTGNIYVGKKIPKEDILGKWIHAEYDIKFSEHEDGYILVKHNEETIREYHGKTSSSSEKNPVWDIYKNKFYFKFWIYRDNYDYGIKKLQDNNKKKSNENLTEDIAAIEKAKEDEKNGHLMTIYFKNYSVES